MRACWAAVALFSCFGCGAVQPFSDVTPESAADVAAEAFNVDAVDVPITMDVADVVPNDVTCSPACFFFEECIGGRCVGRPDVQDVAPEASRCAPLQTLCLFDGDAGSACYDLQTSWDRCGACDVQCAYDTTAMMHGVCTGGSCMCRDSAFTACPSPGAGVIRTLVICTNLQSDPMNCGTCGHRCEVSAPRCVAGVCRN